MRVTVRLFARLRDLAGAGFKPSILDTGLKLSELKWLDRVTRDWPDMQAYEKSISCAVNADYAKFTTVVSNGDEVAFLPPVSGG